MIVVDTSAVIAIMYKEEPAVRLVECIGREKEGERYISAASYLEAGTVIAGRRANRPLGAIGELDDLLADMGIDQVPVDAEQARVALEARIRYGRGFRHGAKLNFGDCFSYALAKTLSAPLLYVGDDFAKTDIVSALAKKRRSKKD